MFKFSERAILELANEEDYMVREEAARAIEQMIVESDCGEIAIVEFYERLLEITESLKGAIATLKP